MGDDNFLNWMTEPREPAGKLEAMQIKNGKHWFDNAKSARDAEWEEMLGRFEQVYLWDGDEPGHLADTRQRRPSVSVFPRREGEARGAIIICAGGGFTFKSYWEAEHIAIRFRDAGLEPFILDYRVKPYTIQDGVADLSRAVRLIRANAGRFNIKPNKIAVTGGSAGGVLSIFASSCFDGGKPNAVDPVERISSRPDAAVISYGTYSPSIVPNTFAEPFPFDEQRARFKDSPGNAVHPDCPPFFLWQTNADDPRYLASFATRLTDAGIPFEMHLFPEGAHGCGLADGGHPFAPYRKSTSRWSQMAIEFLENLGF